MLGESPVLATSREAGDDESGSGLDESTARKGTVPEMVVSVKSHPRWSEE
jgi:hypothetical protein